MRGVVFQMGGFIFKWGGGGGRCPIGALVLMAGGFKKNGRMAGMPPYPMGHTMGNSAV